MWKVAVEAMGKAVVEAKDVAQKKISEGVKNLTRKAQDSSSAVQKSIGHVRRKGSEELPETTQPISDVVREVVAGARGAIISRWEWVKKEIEGRKG